MALNNFTCEGIKSYFSNGPYYIPDYQREYTWDEEVKELWDDIQTIKSENMKQFFMGQIVVHYDEKEDKRYIIDGQQRSITLMILALNILHFSYDIIENNSSLVQSYEKITGGIASGLNIYPDEKEKLILGERDRYFFSNNIVHQRKDAILALTPKYKSQKNMCKAYKVFYDNILSDIEGLNDDEKLNYFKTLYEIFEKKLTIMYIETNDECEAFMIFETLNARGRDLETADLLKNYLFKTSKENIEYIKKEWQDLVDNFNNISVTSFIRYIWNSRHEFINEKILYKKITTKYKTTTEINSLIETLLKDEELYLLLVDPDNHHCFNGIKGQKEIEEEVYELSDLSVKTYIPIVLAYYNKAVNNNLDANQIVNDLCQILNAIEKVLVRDIIIAKRSPASYEREFANLAKRISDDLIVDPSQIVNALKEISIKDDMFEQAFMDYAEKDTAQGKNKIRFVLRKIINKKLGETKIKRDNKEVHIEHIMPQTIGDWDVDPDIHNNNLWKLGNLTLLLQEYNIEISNGLFDSKKAMYAQSDIPITKNLTNYDSWNIDTINDRQRDLLAIAKEIWSF